jgi:hypothetical protein
MRIPRCGIGLLGAAVWTVASAQTQVDLRTQSKSIDFSGMPTKPFQMGSSLPATCSVGQAFFNTAAPPGTNLYVCTAVNVWTQQTVASLPSMTGQAGTVLATDGSTASWTALGGDIAGTAEALRVQGLQGQAVASTAPADGQTLRWSAARNQWAPAGMPANYAAAFTAQTSLTIAGTAHGYPSANLIVECFDTTNTAVEPDSVSINAATYDITVGFAQPQSGTCVVNGSGSGGSGSGAGSYTMSGDVTGTLASTVVTALQGESVAAMPPADGQVLTWSAVQSRWQPQYTSGGGGSALATLAVTLTSSTVLTIGAACSSATPCNVRYGSTVTSIQTPATATVSAGRGLAYIYVDQSGVLTVGSNLTLTCSTSCRAVTGVAGFPNNTIPIAIWNATSGTWDEQGNDARAWLASKVVNAGQGIMVVEAGADTTVAVDAAVVPTYLSGSVTLDFPTIAPGTCGGNMSIAVAGASPGDSVAPGWPSTLAAGVLGTMYVSAANTVSARLCNLSGASVDPAAAVYGATIIRSF